MSIEFSRAFDSGRSSLIPVTPPRRRPRRKATKPKRRPPVSARRLDANRRNAKRSTGPRTPAGKKRASRNALKHGLCSTYACLEGECTATYATFVREFEEELQPRTTLQRALLPHIANLVWRINRLPQAQADMFQLELRRCGKRAAGQLSAAQVLARRFSDEPTSNGFLLIGRYERSLHNQLHRLMSRYEWLKKNRATMPIDEDEARLAHERRWAEIEASIEADARRINAQQQAEEAVRQRVAEQRAAQQQAQTAQAHVDDEQLTRHQPAERTQSNPPQTPDPALKSPKCATIEHAPTTKRTHPDPAPSRAPDRHSPHRADNPTRM